MIGEPRMYTAVSPSPDGRYFLVAYLEKPFSYSVPCGRFPKRVELWDRSGVRGKWEGHYMEETRREGCSAVRGSSLYSLQCRLAPE